MEFRQERDAYSASWVVQNYLAISEPSGILLVPNPTWLILADKFQVTNYDASKFRIDIEGRGVMIAQMYAPDNKITLIGGANAWGEHGYASMLYRLMYDGKNPDTSNIPDGGTFDFAAKCELKLISEEDNLGSSCKSLGTTTSATLIDDIEQFGRETSGLYSSKWCTTCQRNGRTLSECKITEWPESIRVH